MGVLSMQRGFLKLISRVWVITMTPGNLVCLLEQKNQEV